MFTQEVLQDLYNQELCLGEFIVKMNAINEVYVVHPGHITTREFRTDQSRFFVKLNRFGTVVGGDFG